MDSLSPTTVVERLERQLGDLTPAERVVAEQLEAIAAHIVEHVEALPLRLEEPEPETLRAVAASEATSLEGPSAGVATASAPPEESPASVTTAVHAALLDSGAHAVIDELELSLPDRSRRAVMFEELRRLLHRGRPPGPAQPDPIRNLYSLFADTSEVVPLEDGVRRAASRAVERALFGSAPPAWLVPTAPLVTASMMRRFAAYWVDQGPPMFLSLALGFYGASYDWFPRGVDAAFLGYVVVFVCGLVNVGLISRNGTTLGKFALGLRVVSPDGGAVPGRQALLRETFGRCINSFPFCIGYLVGARDPLRQTWGDRIARTRVVRDPTPRWTRAFAGVLGLSLLTFAYGTMFSTRLANVSEAAGSRAARLDSLHAANLRVRLYATRPSPTDSEYVADMRLILAETPAIHRMARALRAEDARTRSLRWMLLPGLNTSTNEKIFALMDQRADCATALATHSILSRIGAPTGREHEARMAQYFASDYEALTNDIVALSDTTAGRR